MEHFAIGQRIDKFNSRVPNLSEAIQEKLITTNVDNIGFIVEEIQAEVFTKEHCDLYTVGNMEQRSFALGLSRKNWGKTVYTN